MAEKKFEGPKFAKKKKKLRMTKTKFGDIYREYKLILSYYYFLFGLSA